MRRGRKERKCTVKPANLQLLGCREIEWEDPSLSREDPLPGSTFSTWRCAWRLSVLPDAFAFLLTPYQVYARAQLVFGNFYFIINRSVSLSVLEANK